MMAGMGPRLKNMMLKTTKTSAVIKTTRPVATRWSQAKLMPSSPFFTSNGPVVWWVLSCLLAPPPRGRLRRLSHTGPKPAFSESTVYDRYTSSETTKNAFGLCNLIEVRPAGGQGGVGGVFYLPYLTK
jgi:hypothetical protein